jgi:hypothetical protein
MKNKILLLICLTQTIVILSQVKNTNPVKNSELISYRGPFIGSDNFIFTNSEYKWQPETMFTFVNFSVYTGVFENQIDALVLNHKYFYINLISFMSNSEKLYNQSFNYYLPFGFKYPLFNTQKTTLTIGSNLYLLPMNGSANENNEVKFPTFVDNQIRFEVGSSLGITALIGYRYQFSNLRVKDIETNMIYDLGNSVNGFYMGIACNWSLGLGGDRCFNKGHWKFANALGNLIKRTNDDSDWSYRIAALKKLDNKEVLLTVALNDKSADVRRVAVSLIDNQEVLEKVAMNDKDPQVVVVAVQKITDQVKLLSIIRSNTNYVVRKTIYEMLTTSSLEILNSDVDDEILKLATMLSLGKISWSEVFNASENTTNSLGAIIGAVALLELPKPSLSDVVSVCHKYIKLGDATRIPELVYLLNNYGNESLAEDYMNCGEKTLEEAGCNWGRAHGYTCITGHGSSKVRWGSAR